MRWFFALISVVLVGAAPVLPDYAVVRPGVPIEFPRDHGAHPAFRTEWWYVTGWLKTAAGKNIGFQITFFRTRPGVDQRNPSAFAPKQIIFAHAAIADPAVGHLRHDQRIARAGFGLAGARLGDGDVRVDDWHIARGADGRWRAHVAGDGFALDIALTPTQAAILQGDAGYSRKGPDPAEASHYFSLPHLAATGTLSRGGKAEAVTGTAWMDREWSSSYLNPRAVGWDWLGLNMNDGGALTLFRIRDAAGKPVWAGGSFRDAAGAQVRLGAADVRFTPGRLWRSKRTGAAWPIAPQVTVMLRGKPLILQISPIMDDQELDSRRGGGPVYWEGAVTVPGGRGYLELTGYFQPLKM
jgi:predicted secreted hydrolase